MHAILVSIFNTQVVVLSCKKYVSLSVDFHYPALLELPHCITVRIFVILLRLYEQFSLFYVLEQFRILRIHDLLDPSPNHIKLSDRGLNKKLSDIGRKSDFDVISAYFKHDGEVRLNCKSHFGRHF